MSHSALIPVAFSSLSRLIATASRFCGRESSLLVVKHAKRDLRCGETVRLALLAPEVRFPIDINAQVVARTMHPYTMKVRYSLSDLSQMECALGQLYQGSEATLPMALDVLTHHHRLCRMSTLSREGATFVVQGEMTADQCALDSKTLLELPHQSGRIDLPGEVSWLTQRQDHSRLHVSFSPMAGAAKQRLDDIVYRFRLGAAPWTPRLTASGL